MRALKKGIIPEILKKNAATWRDTLVATVQGGEKPSKTMLSHYRHVQIKEALLRETSGKCAYCESKLRHITYGDIEHVTPKSKVPAKAFEWSNLTLACDVCNTNKGDYYSDDPLLSQDSLVDPYRDDPKEHFLFMREVVTPRPGSMRGYSTEEVLKLSRGDLLERRRERMTFIDGLVTAYSLAEPHFKPMLLRVLLDNHLKDEDEFSAVTKAYISHLRSDGVLPPV